MKYFISSLGFWSKNVTSILNKNILLLKKKNYLLPCWNCDNFFTAIKIRILKIVEKWSKFDRKYLEN
jgi:hypothetical protein